jgi:hypothetical protein
LNKSLVTAGVGALAVILVCLVGFEVYSWSGNGESRNPNVGHPSKQSGFRGMSRSAADHMTEEQYLEFLKQNRPDLSQAELQQKADAWWKIKSGQTTN